MSDTMNSLPPDRRLPLSADDPKAPRVPGTFNEGEAIGDYVMLPQTDDPGYQLFDDGAGGLIAFLGEPFEQPEATTGFYENLADNVIPDNVLNNISTDLLRRIDQDIEDRKKRDEQYEEGIRRTGLGKDAPGGADFEGASRVVHPMMTEGCIDYQARIMKELWPYVGPVKKKIIGVPTKEKDERAQRKVDYMNWQLTTQITEARSTMETNLTQVPLGGAGYIFQYWDHRLKRPRWDFVAADKVYIPYAAADFWSADRKTFSDTITATQYKERVESGMYRAVHISLGTTGQPPDQTKAQKATDKIAGKDQGGMNLDGDREIYVTQVKLEVTHDMAARLEYEEEGRLYPYLITIDKASRQVLGFYRNWAEDDHTAAALEHLYEFPMIPWRGGPIGLAHIIGGLSGAATGALRALLDSALVANMQGGLVFKGAGVSAQSVKTQPGEFKEIEKPMETDDIRKVAMPFSFNGPSPVLFQLLGFLVDAARGTVRTSLDDTGAINAENVPVGTQLSRVEEGLVVFSAIHGRIHTAFDRLLRGLHRLNQLYMPDVVRVDADGKEILARRKDFENAADIQPVSDPTVYSDQQRFAQVSAIQQRAAMVPGLYKAREVELVFLKLIKWPDPEGILQPAPQPQELNAVNENLAMFMGKPVTVFPEQDHLGHLQVLLDFMRSPMLGSNPLIAAKFMPAALNHAAEHICYYYVARTQQIVSAAAGREAHELMSTDDKVKQAFDQLLAMASQHVVPDLQNTLTGAMPVLQQAEMLMKSLMPPSPQDPAIMASQAAQAETARKAANDKQTGALTAARDNAKAQNDQVRNAIDMQRVEAMRDNAALQSWTRLQQTAQDAATAEDISERRLLSGRAPGYSTGESLSRAS